MNEQAVIDRALWIAHSLFERNKVTGSTSNFSFRLGDQIFMTGSGTCFGTLKREDFSVLDRGFVHTGGPGPSKEWPLHRLMYEKDQRIQAVLHTHSFYSTLWSCLKHENPWDVIPEYTPYLKMKLGKVVLVPYAPPGSSRLFELFGERLTDSNGYLLASHGPVVGAGSMEEAFYGLEELEESARLAWHLTGRERETAKYDTGR